jgi:alpha-tubulin suppressor-like RCC1 family protein
MAHERQWPLLLHEPLWAWGWNGYGQLGLGDSVIRYTPTQVGSSTDWHSVSAGNRGYVFAIKNDGTLWTWGRNRYGVLGLGDTVNRNIPTQVGSGTDWRSVSAGNIDSYAIKTDGTLWSWGYNGDGELGLGDKVDRTTPTQVGTDTHWQEVSANYYAAIALKTDGTLWSWGLNDDGCSDGCGQLGLGQGILEVLTPTQIGTDTNWKSIFPAGDSGVGAAFKNDGTLWVWGFNDYGGLGLGDTTPRYVPTQLGSGTDWQSVPTNYYQTLATKADGTLWAWGNNEYGQLGLGDKVDRLVPTQVGSSTDWGYPTTYSASGSISGIKFNAGSGNHRSQ